MYLLEEPVNNIRSKNPHLISRTNRMLLHSTSTTYQAKQTVSAQHTWSHSVILATHNSIDRRIALTILGAIVVEVVDLVVLEVVAQHAHDAPVLAAVDVDLDGREAPARREDVLDERLPVFGAVQTPDPASLVRRSHAQGKGVRGS